MAGSEIYSSKPGSTDFAAMKLSFRPAARYSGVGLTVQPLAQPAGHAGRRRHTFVPVSKVVTGATSALGAPSFKY